MRDELGPWAVSGPALEIGALALADDDWLRTSAARLQADGRRLDSLLASAGLKIVGGTPLFRLAEHARAPGIADRLASHGIHVRVFARQPDWLRFGLPADEKEFARLKTALG